MAADAPSDGLGHKATQGIDPYLDWILGAGRRHFFLPGRQKEGEELMPLLVRLKGKYTAQDFEDGLFIESEAMRKRWQASVQVPPLYTESPVAGDAAPYFTAMVSADLVALVLSDKEARDLLESVLASVTVGLPLDTQSLPPPKREPVPGKRRP